MNRVRFLLFIIAVLAFSSCTIMSKTHGVYQHIVIDIYAYSNKENITDKKVAMLVCNDKTIPKYDLKYLEFESYIKTILTVKGYSFTNLD